MKNPWELTTIPVPFLMNPLKHHRGFIRSFTTYYAPAWPGNSDEVLQQIQVTGKLMMDIYTGALQVGRILFELEQSLLRQGILEKDDYRGWIAGAHKDFRILSISDDSRWTMLDAKDTQRYVHVHPARNSPWSVRIKALPLKTAILMKLEGKTPAASPVVETINTLRAVYLDEAPIKDGRDTKNTVRIYNILFA